MLEFVSSLKIYKVSCRLTVRNEPQHDYVSANTKTKICVPLIGFSHLQSNVPFAMTSVVVHKITVNLHSHVPLYGGTHQENYFDFGVNKLFD